MRAVHSCRKAVVQYLVEHGCDTTICNYVSVASVCLWSLDWLFVFTFSDFCGAVRTKSDGQSEVRQWDDRISRETVGPIGKLWKNHAYDMSQWQFRSKSFKENDSAYVLKWFNERLLLWLYMHLCNRWLMRYYELVPNRQTERTKILWQVDSVGVWSTNTKNCSATPYRHCFYVLNTCVSGNMGASDDGDSVWRVPLIS
jgi:hypothetical protein